MGQRGEQGLCAALGETSNRELSDSGFALALEFGTDVPGAFLQFVYVAGDTSIRFRQNVEPGWRDLPAENRNRPWSSLQGNHAQARTLQLAAQIRKIVSRRAQAMQPDQCRARGTVGGFLDQGVGGAQGKEVDYGCSAGFRFGA